jgi:SAM-dependent methyltransferase
MIAASAVRKPISGEEYVRQITSLDEDRRARSAFQHLVRHIAPPCGTLFDFGAGPGLDARYFAELGFKVAAYDAAPAMRQYFGEYCRDFIEQGRITLESGTYPEFLARGAEAGQRVDMVISNFAPLSLVPDLKSLFAKFHDLTVPRGRILASVLNAYFIGDMRFRWWLRRVPRLWRDGHYSMPCPEGFVTRRRLDEFAALAAPYFTLSRVFCGMPREPGGVPSALDAHQLGPSGLCRLTRTRFTFLLFEKRD